MTNIEYVRDLMTVGVPTCPIDTPVITLAKTILNDDLEGVVVLDDEGHAAGFVSRDHLVKAYTAGDYHDLTAAAIMSERVPQLPPDIPLSVAAQIMQDQGVRVVYMMHHADGIHYPAAHLTYKHLLRHLIAQDGAELKDLGIRAEREPPLATFLKRRDEARRRATRDDTTGSTT